MVPVPPSESKSLLPGLIETVHAAAWLAVNVRPATVNVPCRAPPVLVVTANVTLPGPEPEAPPVIVNQLVLLLVAVHEHPAAVVTPIAVPVPAAFPRL